MNLHKELAKRKQPADKDILAAIAARYDTSNDVALCWIIDLVERYQERIMLTIDPDDE